MNNLESRLEKLEARAPAENRSWLRMAFDPEDFGGNIAEMDEAIEMASQEVWDSGKQLIALISVSAIEGRLKYSEQLIDYKERLRRRQVAANDAES